MSQLFGLTIDLVVLGTTSVFSGELQLFFTLVDYTMLPMGSLAGNLVGSGGLIV